MTEYAIVAEKPGGPEVMEVQEMSAPTAGPGEVVLRHTAVGLNFIDVYHRSGLYPWPDPKRMIPGSEAAGVVEALGDGVKGFKVGDRVAYTRPMGAYVSVRAMPADRLLKLPDAVSEDTAAGMILKGLTAHYLIHDTFKVEAGMTVLVQAAAGGVGLLLGQWLKAKGVRAIGTAGGPEKVALASEHGYDEVIDYRAGDFTGRVRELAPEGVEAAYDSVGNDTWRGSLDVLRPRGTLVLFGQSSGPITDFDVAELGKGSLYACRPRLFDYISDAEALQKRGAELFAAVESGTVRSEVRNRFALKDAVGAHRALESRKTTGTSVLEP